MRKMRRPSGGGQLAAGQLATGQSRTGTLFLSGQLADLPVGRSPNRCGSVAEWLNAPVLTKLPGAISNNATQRNAMRWPQRGGGQGCSEYKPAVGSKDRCRLSKSWKRGRVVECTGLENRQGSNPFVSSNLTASARNKGALLSGRAPLFLLGEIENSRASEFDTSAGQPMCATVLGCPEGEVHGCTECNLTASARNKGALLSGRASLFLLGKLRTHVASEFETSAGQPMCTAV
jgi:hypothetical protein